MIIHNAIFPLYVSLAERPVRAGIKRHGILFFNGRLVNTSVSPVIVTDTSSSAGHGAVPFVHIAPSRPSCRFYDGAKFEWQDSDFFVNG